MDITIQIADVWSDDLADQTTQLFQELSETYGSQFDDVLSLIDGFAGGIISQFWQPGKIFDQLT